MTGTELRDSWTCGSCGVTSRNPSIGAAPMPERWDRDDEGRPRCLRCARWADPETRRRAVKAALGESASDRLEKEAARARQKLEDGGRGKAKARELLVAREEPWGESALIEVAAEAGVGREDVRQVRRNLADGGAIPASPRGKARRPAPAVTATPAPRPQRRLRDAWREETLALVREIGGEVSPQQMIEASGGAKPVTVRQRLRRLVKDGALTERRGRRPGGRAGGREPVFYRFPD